MLQVSIADAQRASDDATLAEALAGIGRREVWVPIDRDSGEPLVDPERYMRMFIPPTEIEIKRWRAEWPTCRFAGFGLADAKDGRDPSAPSEGLGLPCGPGAAATTRSSDSADRQELDLLPITISKFKRANDKFPVQEQMTWGEFVGAMQTHQPRVSKDGPLFSPVSYQAGETRGNAGVDQVFLAVADIDNPQPGKEGGVADADVLTPERFLELVPADVEVLIVSTHRSTPERPKFRAIVPLATPCAANDWSEAWRRIQAHVWHGVSDEQTKDLARFYYLPSCPPDAQPFVRSRPGRALDWQALPPVAPTPPRGVAPAAVASRVSDRAPSPPAVGHDGALLTFGTGVDNRPDDRPGDRYNAEADWADILEPRGWQLVATSGTELRWRCPNSDKSPREHCATTGHDETDNLHIFCNAEGTPFEGQGLFI